MGILTWIIFGLVAGALAKFIMPGDDPGEIIVTILIGIAGSVLGGFLAGLVGFGAGAATFIRQFSYCSSRSYYTSRFV